MGGVEGGVLGGGGGWSGGRGGLGEQRPFFCAVHLHNVAGVLHAALSAGPRVSLRACVRQSFPLHLRSAVPIMQL